MTVRDFTKEQFMDEYGYLDVYFVQWQKGVLMYIGKVNAEHKIVVEIKPDNDDCFLAKYGVWDFDLDNVLSASIQNNKGEIIVTYN